MKKFTLFFAISVFLMLSCSINGSFQGLYSYHKKTKKSSPYLLVKTNSWDSICSLSKNDVGKIYVINGADLRECLENKKEDAILYIWGPKCKSPVCYPLNVLQQICDENKLELYIIAEYYDAELMQMDYIIERPIFGIDTEFYKTNLTSKYLSRFLGDLIPNKDIQELNRFYYFKKGKYINSFESIENSIGVLKK